MGKFGVLRLRIEKEISKNDIPLQPNYGTGGYGKENGYSQI